MTTASQRIIPILAYRVLPAMHDLLAGYSDSRDDRSGGNAAVENSSVKLLAGYQREVLPDLTLSGQYTVHVMEDHGEDVRSRGPGLPRRSAARHVLTARP